MVARLSTIVMALGLVLIALARLIAGPSYGVVQTIGYVAIALGIILQYWAFRRRRSAILNRSKWERLRAKGQWYYVLVYGVILFGLGTGLLVSLTQWVQNMPPFLPWPNPLEYMVAGAIYGFLIGYWTWFNNESLYWDGADR
jgi:hypothetical protein